MRVTKKKLSLEDYLDFLHSNKQMDLTVGILSEIVSMHGFRKIIGPKKALTDAIETLDLINLSRSTIEDTEISADASLNLEDVIADLSEINWQECCVTSMKTLKSSKQSISSNPPTQSDTTKVKRKRKRGAEAGRIASGCGDVTGSAVSSGSGIVLAEPGKTRAIA